MKIFKITGTYKDLVETLLSLDYKVIAPVNRNKLTRFDFINSADEVLSPDEVLNTVRPAKEHLFPMTETVARFSYEGKKLRIGDVEVPEEKSVIIGLRPCDAAAFDAIDKIFSYVYQDKFYLTRRNNTTLISVACEHPDNACFCTSFGISPDSAKGSDILLKKSKDSSLFAFISTERGEDLARTINNIIPEEQPDPGRDLYEAAEKNMRAPLDLPKIKEALNTNFESEYWNEFSRCLGCGSCAYLCPTCHCFDIVDEVRYDKGIRKKNWDACQFPLFTLHASGHNPRDAQNKRYRQRLMHKFKYYHDRFDTHLCTGCGRCIRECPVNIDIYEAAAELCGCEANI
ncbi:MAG: 4Fe-4S dicluster domain-containing protein [Ignavibacteriaceae bacterium]|nr:4Fe-4S dicluster domain-containing protein [Ignavibacteriaceae bacterium]